MASVLTDGLLGAGPPHHPLPAECGNSALRRLQRYTTSMRFTWGSRKAASNLSKHGVPFPRAVTVFGFAASCLTLAAAGCPVTAVAQGRPDPVALLASQREAMASFGFMDGVWRGPATTILPTGDRHAITQTERVGPFLGGAVKVIEGRGYEPDGKATFNALGIISYNPATRSYSMRSYAQGHAGDFAIERTPDGFTWEIPAGPTTIRYTAVVKDGVWTEVGDRIAPGKDPVRFFEMKLKRIADSDWPAGGAVSPQ